MSHHTIHAKEQPNKPALITEEGIIISYEEFSLQVNRLAHYIKSLQLNVGDHVAILMENRIEYAYFLAAAADCGLLYTPISVHLKASEVEYIINNSESRLLITSKDYLPLTKALINKTQKLEFRVVVDDLNDNEHINLVSALVNQPSTPITYTDSGRSMLYSSGTTGLPKGIVHHIDRFSPLEMNPLSGRMLQALQFTIDSIYLSTQPLYHSAPSEFLAAALKLGSTIVLMKKFDAEQALSLIEKYQITHSQWVPTMFVRMLKLPIEVRNKYDVSSMEVVVHAAAPCPAQVKKKIIDWFGPIVLEYWGGSETFAVTFINSFESLNHPGAVGKAKSATLHIVDEDGNQLPIGEKGLIYIENCQDFEYYKEPEKTAESRNDQGWRFIGDMGYLDEEGYLYLTGRASHMIISGGVNIYPEETENYLINHPKVLDVGVIGVPNEEFGEEVKAVVHLIDTNDACSDLAEELIEYCQQGLSNIKCPRTVDFVDDLPRTPAGKLLKNELRSPYWKGVKRSI